MAAANTVYLPNVKAQRFLLLKNLVFLVEAVPRQEQQMPSVDINAKDTLGFRIRQLYCVRSSH
jgi:hypothetical protein